MTEPLRFYITRIRKRKTRNGSKTVVDLYDRNARLEHPVLTLFDLAELANVSHDPNELEENKETHCRFWAYWELSKKINSEGNRYKDVLYLEPIGGDKNTIGADVSIVMETMTAVLDELKAIKALLLHQVETNDTAEAMKEAFPDAVVTPLPADQTKAIEATNPNQAEPVEAEPTDEDRYRDMYPPDEEPASPDAAPRSDLAKTLFGSDDEEPTANAERAPTPAPNHDVPEEPNFALFQELADEALTEGSVHQPTVDAIIADSNNSYRLATACLEAYVNRARTWGPKQRRHRARVVEALQDLLKDPQVETSLPAGWHWTAKYNDVVAEGKRIKKELTAPAPQPDEDAVPF